MRSSVSRALQETSASSLSASEVEGFPTVWARRFRERRAAATRAERFDELSEGTSSSVSDDCGAGSEGRDGKQKVGRVGIDTGNDGLVERRFCRWGKVGEIGEDCGLLRRTNVEMGVFAIRSASNVSFFSVRRRRLLLDDRVARPRSGDEERGEDESAWSWPMSFGTPAQQKKPLTRGGWAWRLSGVALGKLVLRICD